MKKQLLLFVLTIGLCINAYAQENEELDILEADSTWLKEIIKFPFGFAPEINLKGYEDLRFAKDWSKPERQEFFTYAFVWNTNLTEAPTVNMLESNMRLYYDGLMTAVNKDNNFAYTFLQSVENVATREGGISDPMIFEEVAKIADGRQGYNRAVRERAFQLLRDLQGL